MRFNCDVKDLCAACSEAAKAVSGKSTIPILSGLKMELSGSELLISGYDLEMSVTKKLAVTGQEDGSIVTPSAKTFLQILSKLKGEIRFETNDNNITLSSKKSLVEISGASTEDYPNLPIPDDSKHEIDATALAAAISSTYHNINEKNLKPTLQGACFTVSDGNCEVATTDNVVICTYNFPAELEGCRVILPKAALNVIGTFAGSRETVYFNVASNGNLCFFSDDETVISSRVIGGEFVNYKSIVDKAFQTGAKATATVKRDNLCEALDLANVMSDGQKAATIILKFGADGIDAAVTCQGKKATTRIDCVDCDGQLQVCFNPKYLYDVVSHSGCDKINLILTGELSPMIVEDENKYTSLVMPVRMQA